MSRCDHCGIPRSLIKPMGEIMKSLILTIALTVSGSLFAKTPATDAFNAIIASGEYVGVSGSEKCLVNVLTTSNSVTVSLSTKNSYDVVAVLNSSSHYFVNEATGEISATQSAKYPRYLDGGTKNLYVKSVNNQVEFSISTILLDHRGEDASTYLECIITL